MATRAINNKFEWQFGNSMINYKDGLEEIKQNILTNLYSWVGDCFFDLDAGVDWNKYLGSFKQENNLRDNILKVVKQVEGVINISNFDYYLDNERNFKITLYVNTIYGYLTFNDLGIIQGE